MAYGVLSRVCIASPLHVSAERTRCHAFNPQQRQTARAELGQDNRVEYVGRLGARIKDKAAHLWNDANEMKRTFVRDVEEWGVGAEPIFTIVVSSDGRLQVKVDEDEISGRCGLQSLISKRKLVASEQISKARQLANDIEKGLFRPPAMSTLFRFVKEGEKQMGLRSSVTTAKTYVQQAQPFLVGGLVASIAMAVLSYIVGQMLRRSTDEDRPSHSGVQNFKSSETELLATINEERLLKIRGMARQALLDDETRNAPTETLPQPLQYAAAARAHLAKKQQETVITVSAGQPKQKADSIAHASNVDIAALAQQLDEIRRMGDDEFSANVIEESSKSIPKDEIGITKVQDGVPLGGPLRSAEEPAKENGRVVVNGSMDGSTNGRSVCVKENLPSPSTPVAMDIENELHKQAEVPDVPQKPAIIKKRVKPRIITSFAEASEVLSAKRQNPIKERKNPDKITKNKEAEGSSILHADDVSKPAVLLTDEVPQYIEEPKQIQNGNFPSDVKNAVVKAQDDSMKNDVLQTNEQAGSNPMNPEVSEKKLGSEAEKTKARINGRAAASARKESSTLSSQFQNTAKADGVIGTRVDKSLSNSLKSTAKQVKRPSRRKADKTVITSSSGRRPDQPSLKPTNKKVWPKDLQRRYDRETDPNVRALMKEIGKDLDEWISEDEVEETLRLFNQGPEGQQELIHRMHAKWREAANQEGDSDLPDSLERYKKIEEKFNKQIDLFGPQAMLNKYREYKPDKPDYLWWFDLPYVACIGLRNDEQKLAPGLYSMDMAEKDKDTKSKMHVIAFEDQHDALNLCRILVPELDKLGGATGAGIVPFEPKELFREASSAGSKVTVLKKGQVEMFAGKPLEEVEARILEIGRDVYVQERLRERSIDINAIMEDLGRGL